MREAHVASAFRVAEKLYEALADDVQRLGMTRRDFLRVATSAAAGMLLTACPPSVLAAILNAIKNRRVRKDISALSAGDPDLVTFKSAVAMMKALPSTSPLNWINQANIHANFCCS